MEEEEEVQYRIEIQDGEGLGEDGDVMVVLDLNGQDLPESVAQTILEIAQNSRHSDLREHLSHIFVEKAEGCHDHDGQIIQYVTRVDGGAGSVVEAIDDLVTEIKIEEPEHNFSSGHSLKSIIHHVRDESGNIVVHDLAELEQMKANGVEAYSYEADEVTLVKSLVSIAHPNSRPASLVSTHDSEQLLGQSDLKVEMGVQCEIINLPADQQSENASKKDNGYCPPEMDLSSNKAETSVNIVKSEPLLADDEASMAGKSTEPEEMALVPDQSPTDRSCSLCTYVCSNDLELGRHRKEVHNEPKPFMCSTCVASFELELSFQIHTLVHADKPTLKPPKKSYVCPICKLKTHKLRALTSHVAREHSSSTIYSCTKCRFSTTHKTELSEHYKSESHSGKRNKVAVCPVCSVACLKLPAHLASCHPDHRPYSCELCNYKSKTSYALRSHMLTHTVGKDFVCPQCHKACKSQISLKRHVNNHNPVKKFQCPLCSFSSNDSYEFKRHGIRVHTRKAYYSCKFCNLSFVNHCDLKLHAMSEHKSKDSFYCKFKQCSFSCETKAEFKRHVQTHTGEHRFLCDICDFSTPWKAHLERHLATHSDLRPFKCDVCPYECREKINLKKHMVTHSDYKPFQCTRCPYTCKLKNLLDSHTRIMHTSLKPYACSNCTYTTKTASNLKKHMWIHEQYKPFKCRFCLYTAREKNKLRRHESLKHKHLVHGEEDVKAEVMPDVVEYRIVFTNT